MALKLALQSPPEIRSCDFLIIGGGIIGSSVAMHLSRSGAQSVRVVDFDLEGSFSSTELNAGGVRGTWAQPVNILSSKLSIDYFAKHAEEVGYRACGYLWLHSEKRLPSALRARELQLSYSWPVEAWDVAELKRRAPLIDKTDGIAGAIFCQRDGLLNPNLLKLHYRKESIRKGAIFDDRVWVKKAEITHDGVRIEAAVFPQNIETEDKLKIYSGDALESARSVEYRAKIVVNCAGAWASQIAAILGYRCPSQAFRRQVSIFDCRDADLTQYGMIVDTSGVYFHPEAANGLAGYADHDEKPGVNFKYDGEEFFMERIWPALYERSSAFERLKHLTGWAGLYEVSPDDSAIVGRVGDGPIYEAHSFSGHGVMHSYSAGLALAELILNGRYETLDLSELVGSRFEKAHSVREQLVI